MRFIYIFSLLALIAFKDSFASFNWKKVTTNKNGDTFYIDQNIVKNNFKTVHINVLINSSPVAISSRSGIKSIIYKIETDCKKLRYKTLNSYFYSDFMAKGRKSISSEYYSLNFSSKGYWTYVSEDSPEQRVVENLCNNIKEKNVIE
jgi:hypothetical protein